MLTIRIHNDGTGDHATGNYDYCVFVNTKVIADGRIEGHCRDHGWEELVKLLLEDRTDAKRSIHSAVKKSSINSNVLQSAIAKLIHCRVTPNEVESEEEAYQFTTCDPNGHQWAVGEEYYILKSLEGIIPISLREISNV